MKEMIVRYLEPRLFRLLLHAFLMCSDRDGLKTTGTFLLFGGPIFACNYYYSCFYKNGGVNWIVSIPNYT